MTSNNLQLDTLPTFYHLSQSKFEFPVDPIRENYGADSDRHPKASLGFWLCPDASMVGNLGQYTYEVVLKPTARKLTLPIRDLVRFYRDRIKLNHEEVLNATFEYRETLRKDYDVVFLDDADGSIGEVIVLNLDCIETFRLQF